MAVAAAAGSAAAGSAAAGSAAARATGSDGGGKPKGHRSNFVSLLHALSRHFPTVKMAETVRCCKDLLREIPRLGRDT